VTAPTRGIRPPFDQEFTPLMTSPGSPLPGARRIGPALRAGLRTALHVRPAHPTRPPRAVAPAVLASVAVVVGLVIATGGSAEARSAAALRPATATTPIGADGRALASQADVALAMRAFGISTGPGQRADHVSRSAQRAPLHRWVRPNYGPLSSPFGYRWGRLHAGIDLAGPYGSPIVAATDGCISYAGPEAGYGEVMRITDWDGTETLYGHMSAFVRTAGCVKAGEVIARVGSTGDATGAHLHFGIYINGAPVDPLPFLRDHGVVI
jgi:murein DD-endopeptidase MepM/ murein hydrolase activator NlpD